ncbi:MAG: hypothetical protein PHU23_13350 [Dehalococcoidales bacterium]|nr:hypothetical protein [Dehalococcoidales bacterium]
MTRALTVFGFFTLGFLLFAIAIFGMMGIWKNLLFIPLTVLQHSMEAVLILIGFGFASWFFGSILLRVK